MRNSKRRKKRNSLVFLLPKTLSFDISNRNGQGLVNGVGYSAADWSVTDTFSLAVFSKVRFFFFL